MSTVDVFSSHLGLVQTMCQRVVDAMNMTLNDPRMTLKFYDQIMRDATILRTLSTSFRHVIPHGNLIEFKNRTTEWFALARCLQRMI